MVVIQAVLLGHRLPLMVWPCSALMTGGAVMGEAGWVGVGGWVLLAGAAGWVRRGWVGDWVG